MTQHDLNSSRRQFVQTLGTAAGVAAFPALAQANEVKVGFLLPLTGSFAESGQLIKEAVEMAIDIGGTKIEYNSKNPSGPGNPLSEFFKALVGAEFTVLLDTKENKIIKVLDREEFVKKLVNANPAMQPLLNGILDEKAFIDMSEPTFRVVPNKEVAQGDS